MAKEYIEREALLERFNYNGPMNLPPKEYYREAVTKFPAADVAPVVHGEWIPIVNYFHGKPNGQYYCSVCHRVENIKGIYCRLCGARMDGGKR